MRILHLLSPMPQTRAEEGAGEDARLLLPELLLRSENNVVQDVLGLDGHSAAAWAGWLKREVVPVPVRGIRSARLLPKELSEPSCDLIHAWGLPAALAAALAYHSDDKDQDGRPILASLGTPPADQDDLTVLRDYSAWPRSGVVVGQESQRRAWLGTGFHGDHIHILPPGIPEFSPLPNPTPNTQHPTSEIPNLKSELRTQNSKLKTPPTLLAIPSPSLHSHTNDAIWAGALLRQLYPDLKVVVYGEGPATEQVWRFAQSLYMPDMTRFAGWDTPLPQLIQAADAVLFAGSPAAATTPLIWAMAGGVPIVAADTPAVADLIVHGETGLLAAPNSPRDLASKTLQLLEDPSLAQRLAKSAQHRVSSFPSLADMAARYRELWQEIIAGPAAP